MDRIGDKAFFLPPLTMFVRLRLVISILDARRRQSHPPIPMDPGERPNAKTVLSD